MVFYLALLPALVDLAGMTVVGYAKLVAVTLLVLAGVFTSYVVLAARARRLFTSPRALKAVNRGTGALMAGAAAAIATR
jgi:threonine/homoserine/homoserine lactone efflux protein